LRKKKAFQPSWVIEGKTVKEKRGSNCLLPYGNQGKTTGKKREGKAVIKRKERDLFREGKLHPHKT